MVPAPDPLAPLSGVQIIPGSIIGGRFRVDAFLFQDAISQTFRAFDTGQGIPATIRIISARALGPAGSPLEADVEKASAIVHKNLVDVLLVGREADFYFIATELLDGQTLREFLDSKLGEGAGISLKGGYNLVAHVANGLEKAQAVMPHGALNPSNIWVGKSGRVKIANLGLGRTFPALAGRDGGSAIDQIYVAPEVLAGGAPTLTGDVYSLGAILFEVLTGRPPSAGIGASEVNPDVPPEVDRIITRALSKSPAGRYATAADFRNALSAGLALQGSGGADAISNATTDRPSPTAGRPVQPAASGTTIPPGNKSGLTPLGEPARLTLGKSFNVMEAAGGADDNQERWLIQKDKLDFGPFSLAQIKAQIESGEIRGEHMIVDSDSGARKKVKDFPGLQDFTKNAERRLEQQRRARAEKAHETVEKKKSMATFAIVGAAVIVVAGALAFYLLSRKAADGGQLASREEEQEVDAFLKGVKINFATAHVAKRTSGGGHRAGGGDEFNNDLNIGDVTKGGGGDETLSDDVIQHVMMGNYRSLVPCIVQERRRAPGISDMNIDFVVRGTGRVSAVKVNGQSGGGFSGCVLGRMQGFGFPRFNGAKTIASWSMSLR
ncbi:MAG TPA: protein kinase [Polyangia bacterium]|jgi:serine/threonine protein kinase|nr:protein kinase [Polyangia bacterium]